MLPFRAFSAVPLVAALAGCGPQAVPPDPTAAPVMVERSHSHRHVHGPDTAHGHTHPDFPVGVHAHEHDGH